MRILKEQQISAHCILACLYFLLLPTTIAVNSAGNSILKLATIPIGLFFLITLLLSNRKLNLNIVHFALILFTLSVVATLFVDSGSMSVDFVIGYILNAALYICLSVFPYNKAELELMEKVQIVLLVILNVLTLFSNGTRANRTTFMIMGQTSDPNYFVGFFVFPLTIALKQLASGKQRIFHLLLLATTLYSVYLSGSRGGLLAVAATVACFALLYPSGIGKRLGYFLGGFALIVVLWFIAKPFLPENIVERMSIDNVIESGGTGRLVIWKSMLREIVDQPDKLILGRGINAMYRLFVNGIWTDAVAHNQLLQTLYNQGLMGLLSFLFLTGVSFFRCIKRRKTVAIAILGMMALSVSLSFNQTTRTFWNLIAYAAFVFPNDDIMNKDHGGISENG